MCVQNQQNICYMRLLIPDKTRHSTRKSPTRQPPPPCSLFFAFGSRIHQRHIINTRHRVANTIWLKVVFGWIASRTLSFIPCLARRQPNDCMLVATWTKEVNARGKSRTRRCTTLHTQGMWGQNYGFFACPALLFCAVTNVEHVIIMGLTSLRRCICRCSKYEHSSIMFTSIDSTMFNTNNTVKACLDILLRKKRRRTYFGFLILYNWIKHVLFLAWLNVAFQVFTNNEHDVAFNLLRTIKKSKHFSTYTVTLSHNG